MQKNWGRDPARRTGPEYEHPKIRAMLQSARIDIEFDAVDGTDDRPCEFDRRAGSSIVLALSGLRRALQFIELDLRDAAHCSRQQERGERQLAPHHGLTVNCVRAPTCILRSLL